VIAWLLDLQLPVQSVPITIKNSLPEIMPDYKPKRYIPPPDEIKKGNYTQYFS
jgi:hypothetical protein